MKRDFQDIHLANTKSEITMPERIPEVNKAIKGTFLDVFKVVKKNKEEKKKR
jgi:hypothetical protein